MIQKQFLENIANELQDLKSQGLYKSEYSITSSQSAEVDIIDQNGNKKSVINLCANNYLGLADHPALREVAKKAIDKYGFGTASVRFICGTMDVNREFEISMAQFLGYEDVISYSSCFAANNGVFAALFDADDAIISADLNHASLIDGIRLCKAQRFFYKFDDMADLEEKIKAAVPASKSRIIVTDGVFSMDGDIAKLKEICDLAEKYNCMVMVDDSHATGFVGENGKGTIEFCGVMGRVDILSSTLGKALGGAGGGFIASKKEIIDKLRNKSRPYLFSNNTIPAVAAVALEILKMLKNSKNLISKLSDNTKYFRSKMLEAGFDIRPGIHPVAPVMLYDAKLAAAVAKDLIEEEGIYVVAFSFPVVPKNEARIRVQISAAHSKEHLDKAINAFIRIGKKHKVI
ncbi:MAG: 2-amino-3-ketobutyrate coenzyme ligase [Rickettsiaceae bacterium]|jgi:glycine C-acetyltransferase|nr:2-amino-3-ketobutyrate coenzyme ligase [Rickettsiaceae bacterium]